MDLTNTDTLATLMLPREKRPKVKRAPNYSKGFALVRGDAGLVKVPINEITKVGQYEGKQGSIRRSRKGRTWIMPNGYVYYNGIGAGYVVAYTS